MYILYLLPEKYPVGSGPLWTDVLFQAPTIRILDKVTRSVQMPENNDIDLYIRILDPNSTSLKYQLQIRAHLHRS